MDLNNDNFSEPKKSIWKKNLGEIWTEFKDSLKTKEGRKKFIIFFVIFIIIVATGVTVYARYFSKQKSSTGSAISKILPKFADDTKTEPKKVVSSLDGQMYNEDVSNRHPVAVMIENHPDARPQSGLDKAKIVYEAIAEGGITRFMAIFGPESASKVGPVRSARTYYLDWALEYDAFYAHVGGNIDALDLIPQIKIKDLDQFRYGTEAYWRVPQTGKATEHTMYTDTDKLWNIASDNKWSITSSFDSYAFKTDSPEAQRPESQDVSINFSTATYEVTWKYNKKDNLYYREMAGVAHKDAVSGNQLTAKNVLIEEVQRTPVVTRINESGWSMDTVGEGKAKVLMDGKLIEGKWKKTSRTARTNFYDADGNKLQFDPGVFWYEIVSPGTAVTVS